MKRGLLTLGLGVLSALTMRAGPVTDISSGNIIRDYVWPTYWQEGEVDGLGFSGSNGGVGFSISCSPSCTMTQNLMWFGGAFTDQITAAFAELCMPSCVFGTVTLDIQATLNGWRYPECPPPDSSWYGCQWLPPTGDTGYFSATGSFIALGGGVDLPLDGVGTTTAAYTTVFDPTIPAAEYVPASISYNFIAVPEPSVIFTTGLGLGLLALMRWSRRRAH